MFFKCESDDEDKKLEEPPQPEPARPAIPRSNSRPVVVPNRGSEYEEEEEEEETMGQSVQMAYSYQTAVDLRSKQKALRKFEKTHSKSADQSESDYSKGPRK